MISINKKRKSSSCPFAGAKKAPKRKKSSKRLSKDHAEDLAASKKGSGVLRAATIARVDH